MVLYQPRGAAATWRFATVPRRAWPGRYACFSSLVDPPPVNSPLADAPLADAPPLVDAPRVNTPVVNTPVVNTPVVDGLLGDAEKALASAAAITGNRPARTRFAPSPTGYMHIGSLRTALFSWLLAKGTGGHFILRIEDTDRDRLVPDAEERILDDLRWARLLWDEGPGRERKYGPYRQSQRLEHYQRSAKKLLDEGKAYRCFCDHRALDQFTLGSGVVPDGAFRAGTRYPGKCRSVTAKESSERALAGERHVVRFKSDRRFSFVDAVYGRYEKGEDEEDFVIMKSDGFPTYHFANVVDDALMRITHVVRGDEWLISTPKHIALYDALELRPPVFAHLGLLVGPSGEKLSKRAGDISVRAYRDKGYDGLVLLNWLALHGSRLKPAMGKGAQADVVPHMDALTSSFSYQFTKGAITPNFSKLEHINSVFMYRARTVSNGWAMVTRTMSLPVLKIIRAVENHRTSDQPDRLFNFYNNEGDVCGGLNVDNLGPLIPDLQGGLFEQDAEEIRFPWLSKLDPAQLATLQPASKARYTAAALVMYGPPRNAVPVNVVLSASNMIWRPTREKYVSGFATLARAHTQFGVYYSPIRLWKLLLRAVNIGKDPVAVVTTEIDGLIESIPDVTRPAKARVVALLHGWVRQALVGSYDDVSPSTGNTFEFLGPKESAVRLEMAIDIGTELNCDKPYVGGSAA